MKRRGHVTLAFVTTILIALLVVVNSAISNATAWASAVSDEQRLRASTEGLVWMGMAVLLAILALGFASWLATGRISWVFPRSLKAFIQSFSGLHQLTPTQRKLALLLMAPPFLLLDIALGLVLWSLTRANLLVWLSSPGLPTIIATVGAESVLLAAVVVVACLQVLYVRYAFRAERMARKGAGKTQSPGSRQDSPQLG